MRVLFITATRLGDAILSTGALGWLAEKYPSAEITVACGSLVAGLFHPAPGVRRVVPMTKEPWAGHWRKLWSETRGVRWDIVVDLRNGPVSRVLRAKEKYIWGRTDTHRHKVEQIADVIGACPAPAPRLWLDGAARAAAARLVPDGAPVLALGPAANWPAKTWPAENFIDLLGRLSASDGILPGARVAIIAAPGEEAHARIVLGSIPAERRIDVIGKTSPLEAAAALARCAFYVGNDSGLMHAAAAVGVPTLGLFGPSFPRLYRPWGAHCAYVSTPESFDRLIDYPGYNPKTAPCLMRTLTVEMAERAAQDLWRQSRTRPSPP